MAISTGVAIGVGSEIYQGVAGNQQRQKAKGQANAILNTRPTLAQDQLAVNEGALAAQATKRKQLASTASTNSTILTGPQGAAAPPPATKTLLGL